MGMNPWIKRSSLNNYVSPNPNPRNFKIIGLDLINNWTLATVKYPGCTRFESIKLLVFEGYIGNDLLKLDELDPHFTDGQFSPVARFPGNESGRILALEFMNKVNRV